MTNTQRTKNTEPILRCCIDDARRGSLNLAIDQALLEDDGQWLRFYRWKPATLSLGYFQAFDDFADLEGEVPIVRRQTGGAAILHDQELTISLSIDEKLLPGSVEDSYTLLHDAVQDAAESLELGGLRPAGEVRKAQSRDARLGRWCFFAPKGQDLVDEQGKKVFGSAQRRTGGRVLHHGSLVLAANHWTPFTGALLPRDKATREAELCEVLGDRIGAALGLSRRDAGPIEDPLLRRAESIEVSRYATDSWTKRR